MSKNVKDLTNQKFNLLTAIRPIEKPIFSKSKSRSTWWECVCECGKKRIVRSTELIRGDTKSCGCANKFDKSSKYKGVGKLAQSKFSHIKYGAISRGLEFNITIEFAWELFQKQKGKCFYTGFEIELKPRNNGHMTASLDRIDSSKGYLKDNIVWVHKDVNLMKNSFTNEYFLNLCELITQNHQSKTVIIALRKN